MIDSECIICTQIKYCYVSLMGFCHLYSNKIKIFWMHGQYENKLHLFKFNPVIPALQKSIYYIKCPLNAIS